MAFATNSLVDIFAGATVSTGDVTIPSGTITSFTPASLTDPGPAEFVFGMCETMHQKVSAANLTNCTTAVTTTLSGGNTLKKVYTFTVNLDFQNSQLADLNVKAES